MILSVRDQDIRVTESDKLVQNSVEVYHVQFEFADDWDDFIVTAVFKQDDREAYEVLLDSTHECVLPWECLKTVRPLRIGVYGVSGAQVKPTVWTQRLIVYAGTDTEGVEARPATASPYAQLLENQGDLQSLITTQKGTLVDAINEAYASHGGAVAVASVNGKVGTVELTAEDVGAIPTYQGSEYDGMTVRVNSDGVLTLAPFYSLTDNQSGGQTVQI